MRIRLSFSSVSQLHKTFPRYIRWIGNNAFLGFLCFFLIAFLISTGVFYKYVWSLQYIETQQTTQTSFQNALFQNILETWQLHGTLFEQAGQQQHRNIFTPSGIEEN